VRRRGERERAKGNGGRRKGDGEKGIGVSRYWLQVKFRVLPMRTLKWIFFSDTKPVLKIVQ
jgi:hypothetical protein